MTKKLNDVGINISVDIKKTKGGICEINSPCTILTPKKWNWHEIYANLYGRSLSPSEISSFCRSANVNTTKDLVFNSSDPAIKWLKRWKPWA